MQFHGTSLADNLVLPSTRYIFVLESPHVEELKYGVPVAGRSGQSMTRIIPSTGSGHRFEEAFDLPLGRLLLYSLRPKTYVFGLPVTEKRQ